MASARASLDSTLRDYAQLNTVPALLSIVFAVASLYAFGGVSEIHLEWFNYTLTAEHSTIFSLAVLAVAFASSETREFQNYERWEQIMIALAPVLIVGNQYTNFVSDFIATNAPAAGIAAFLITVASWGVAVR
ncbi:hypothetical protein [Natronomonas amylolytica]|uniref:hypothetical protein n=1 Tax=Natronomonas amylolytica TaxID=3108498 RepID=UPI00300BB04C